MSAVFTECPLTITMMKASNGVTRRMIAEHADEQPRRPEHRAPIEQHPDRDEEEHGEDIAHRQNISAGLIADLRLPDDHAAEECAERHGSTERHVGNRRHADRHHQHREREQFRERSRATRKSSHGTKRAPASIMIAVSSASFRTAMHDCLARYSIRRQPSQPPPAPAPARAR